jgi:hypothetical protein
MFLTPVASGQTNRITVLVGHGDLSNLFILTAVPSYYSHGIKSYHQIYLIFPFVIGV